MCLPRVGLHASSWSFWIFSPHSPSAAQAARVAALGSSHVGDKAAPSSSPLPLGAPPASVILLRNILLFAAALSGGPCLVNAAASRGWVLELHICSSFFLILIYFFFSTEQRSALIHFGNIPIWYDNILIHVTYFFFYWGFYVFLSFFLASTHPIDFSLSLYYFSSSGSSGGRPLVLVPSVGEVLPWVSPVWAAMLSGVAPGALGVGVLLTWMAPLCVTFYVGKVL